MTTAYTPERLADRAQITDALARYARGVDRRNWEFVRSAFHAGATVDQGDYKGSAEGLVESMVARHGAIEQSMHILTNTLIEFDGPDSAIVETCYTAIQRNAHLPVEMRRALLGATAPAEGKIDLRALGRYVDRFERRHGAWRIARRVCIVETIVGSPAPSAATYSDRWVVQKRDSDDALWAARAAVGLDGPIG
ncbi:MAG TPA: nuclear transport factor 2 family protein [Alphaproteobacteria bacterium]|nr:nuclear transport factor 2 family protein [Alphaproteobacteria bacterium]